MPDVAAVPVRAGVASVPTHGIRIGNLGWADSHWLAQIPRSRLARALHVVDDGPLRAIEDSLTEIMALADLCATTPMAPHSPGGPITYPRWGDIYWVPALAAQTGQIKRFVVVSHDHHNATGHAPFIVRTTSQPKRNLEDFPEIQGGGVHACCGEVRNHKVRGFNMASRPQPDSLTIDDMSGVAYGIASALELEDAVGRAGGMIP
jgi:hypothetical protein